MHCSWERFYRHIGTSPKLKKIPKDILLLRLWDKLYLPTLYSSFLVLASSSLIPALTTHYWQIFHATNPLKASRGEAGLCTEIAVPTPLIYFPAVVYFIYIAGILGRLICIFGDIFKQIQEEEYMQEAPNIIRYTTKVWLAFVYFLRTTSLRLLASPFSTTQHDTF